MAHIEEFNGATHRQRGLDRCFVDSLAANRSHTEHHPSGRLGPRRVRDSPYPATVDKTSLIRTYLPIGARSLPMAAPTFGCRYDVTSLDHVEDLDVVAFDSGSAVACASSAACWRNSSARSSVARIASSSSQSVMASAFPLCRSMSRSAPLPPLCRTTGTTFARNELTPSPIASPEPSIKLTRARSSLTSHSAASRLHASAPLRTPHSMLARPPWLPKLRTLIARRTHPVKVRPSPQSVRVATRSSRAGSRATSRCGRDGSPRSYLPLGARHTSAR